VLCKKHSRKSEMQENEPMRYHIEDPSNEKRINIVLLIDGR